MTEETITITEEDIPKNLVSFMSGYWDPKIDRFIRQYAAGQPTAALQYLKEYIVKARNSDWEEYWYMGYINSKVIPALNIKLE